MKSWKLGQRTTGVFWPSIIIIIIIFIIIVVLFISHTTSCIGGHVSLGHQAISYSLRCLGSFFLLLFLF